MAIRESSASNHSKKEVRSFTMLVKLLNCRKLELQVIVAEPGPDVQDLQKYQLSASRIPSDCKDMNIRYLDYKIKVEESTLIQQYPADHEVLRDPSAIGKQGWVAFRSIYLDKQNVTLDVERFRPTLVRALQLLHQ
uniref:Uncharacterized protein n=1 Tax=Salix viminalis TaxID=40686 RepID=A0A6N2LT86_SALVM